MDFRTGDIVIRDMGHLKEYTKYGHGSIGEIIKKTSLGNYLVKIVRGENFMQTGSEQAWAPSLTRPYNLINRQPDWEV